MDVILHQQIKQYVKKKQNELTPQVLAANKVRISKQNKSKLFQLLMENDNYTQIQNFIESDRIVKKAKPFFRRQSRRIYQDIKLIKQSYQRFSMTYIANNPRFENSVMQSFISQNLGLDLKYNNTKEQMKQELILISQNDHKKKIQKNLQVQNCKNPIKKIIEQHQKKGYTRRNIEIILKQALTNNQLGNKVSQFSKQYKEVKSILNLLYTHTPENKVKQSVLQELKTRRVEEQNLLTKYLICLNFYKKDDVKDIVKQILDDYYETLEINLPIGKIIESSLPKQSIYKKLKQIIYLSQNNKFQQIKNLISQQELEFVFIERNSQNPEKKFKKSKKRKDSFARSSQSIENLKVKKQNQYSYSNLNKSIKLKSSQIKKNSDQQRFTLKYTKSQIKETHPNSQKKKNKDIQVPKKFYMILKLANKINLLLCKLQIVTGDGTIVSFSHYIMVYNYNLIQFEINLVNQQYYFSYIDQNQIEYISNKINTSIFDQQVNFLIDQDIIFHPKQQKNKNLFNFGIGKSNICSTHIAERYLVFCFLGRQNILKKLCNWLSKKPEIRLKIIQKIKDFKDNQQLLKLKHVLNKNKRLMIFPYALAYLYNFTQKQPQNFNNSYIQFNFMTAIRYNHIQKLPQLHQYQNILKQSLLKIYYLYGQQKWYYNTIEILFNDLIDENPLENVGFLMEILYKGKLQKRICKLKKIDKEKLKNLIQQFKNLLNVIEYTAYQLICQFYDYDESKEISPRIIQIIKNINNTLVNINQIPKSKKEELYYFSICCKILSLFYKSKNFILTGQSLIQIQFYLSLLQKRYRCIFITDIFKQKFIKSLQQQLNKKSPLTINILSDTFVKFIQLGIIQKSEFENFIIKFLDVKKPNDLQKSINNKLTNKQWQFLSNLNQSIIFPFYYKKFPQKLKYNIMNHFIKLFQFYHFQEIFEIVDAGFSKYDLKNIEEHRDIVSYAISKLIQISQKNKQRLYMELISKKQWLFICKLSYPIKNILYQRIVGEVKKYNQKNQIILVEICVQTILNANTAMISEQQKNWMLSIIYDFNNQNSFQLRQIRSLLYSIPHMSSIYVQLINRSPIQVKNRIKNHLLTVKQELQEGKIIFKQYDHISKYDESILKQLYTLFDIVGNKSLKNLISSLNNRVQYYLQKIQLIEQIAKIFSENLMNSQQIIRYSQNLYNQHYQSKRPITLELTQYLSKFDIILPQMLKIKNLTNLKPLITQKFETVEQFCDYLDKKLQLTILVCQKYKENQLTYDKIKYFNETCKINTNDLTQLFNEFLDLEKSQKLESICTKSNIFGFNMFSSIFSYIIQPKLSTNTLIEIGDLQIIFQKFLKNKPNQINLMSFDQRIVSFEKFAALLNLNIDKQLKETMMILKIYQKIFSTESITLDEWIIFKNYLTIQTEFRMETYPTPQFISNWLKHKKVIQFIFTQDFEFIFKKITSWLDTILKCLKIKIDHRQQYFINSTNPKIISLILRSKINNKVSSKTEIIEQCQKQLIMNSTNKLFFQLFENKQTKEKQTINKIIQQLKYKIQFINEITKVNYLIIYTRNNNVLDPTLNPFYEESNTKVLKLDEIKSFNHLASHIEQFCHSEILTKFQILINQSQKLLIFVVHLIQNILNKKPNKKIHIFIQKQNLSNNIYYENSYPISYEILFIENISKQYLNNPIFEEKISKYQNQLQLKSIKQKEHRTEYKIKIINKEEKAKKIQKCPELRYQKIKCIGEGGQATVYLCKDKFQDNKQKVLRICSLNFNQKYLDLKRTLHQPILLKNINHPNIIKIQSYWQSSSLLTGRTLNMILQYAQGGDLTKYIGELSRQNIIKIYRDVKSALQQLHKNNIVHRDITKRNILIKKKYQSQITAILTDLGISTVMKQEQKGVHVTVKGLATFHYKPPEFIYQQKVSTKSDLWNLGIVMLQMTLGEPIQNLRIKQSALNQDFPQLELNKLRLNGENECIIRVIQQLLEKDPTKRIMTNIQ